MTENMHVEKSCLCKWRVLSEAISLPGLCQIFKNQVSKVVEQGEKEKKVLQSQLFSLEIVSEIG